MRLKLCFIALLIHSSILHAAEPAYSTDHIAVIDLEKLSNRLTASDKSVSAMRDKVKQVSGDYNSKKRKAEDLAEEIRRTDGVISRDDLDKKRKEVSRLQNEMQELDTQLRREVQLMEDTVLVPLQKKIEYAIEAVARDKQIRFVFKAGQLAYADQSSDITELVIARLKQMENTPVGATETTSSASTAPAEPKQAAPATRTPAASPTTKPALRPVDRQAD